MIIRLSVRVTQRLIQTPLKLKKCGWQLIESVVDVQVAIELAILASTFMAAASRESRADDCIVQNLASLEQFTRVLPTVPL